MKNGQKEIDIVVSRQHGFVAISEKLYLNSNCYTERSRIVLFEIEAWFDYAHYDNPIIFQKLPVNFIKQIFSPNLYCV